MTVSSFQFKMKRVIISAMALLTYADQNMQLQQIHKNHSTDEQSRAQQKGANFSRFQIIPQSILALQRKPKWGVLNVSGDHDCSISHRQLYDF